MRKSSDSDTDVIEDPDSPPINRGKRLINQTGRRQSKDGKLVTEHDNQYLDRDT